MSSVIVAEPPPGSEPRFCSTSARTTGPKDTNPEAPISQYVVHTAMYVSLDTSENTELPPRWPSGVSSSA